MLMGKNIFVRGIKNEEKYRKTNDSFADSIDRQLWMCKTANSDRKCFRQDF
jgi:hypothetical protein